MMGSGTMTCSTARVSRLGPMDHALMDTTIRARKTASVPTPGLTEALMQANGSITG